MKLTKPPVSLPNSPASKPYYFGPQRSLRKWSCQLNPKKPLSHRALVCRLQYQEPAPQQLVQTIVRQIQPGGIILMHDGNRG
ncbi:MAG: hypothetical protein F6K32_24090 [Desertifilum sp. SIO1I2]|nr:hypothetical protein [Desertifilum sp. SIO1I2]